MATSISVGWLRSWLNDLSGSATGRLHLVNMYLCWQKGIVSVAQIEAFLSACSKAMVLDPEHAFDDVCRQDNGKEMLYFAMMPVKKESMNGKVRLSSTIKTDTFHTYLLSKSYKAAPPGLVSYVLDHAPATPDEQQEYKEELAMVTSLPDWYEPGTTLGKPFPNPLHCWFTLTSALERSANGKDCDATHARDVLGLVDCKDGEHRLEVRFLSQAIKGSPDVKVGRPTFADLGNARFAAFQNGYSPNQNHKRGWGTTVHLGKLAKNHQKIYGIPERVSTPVPITVIAGIIVTYLGKIAGTRGQLAKIDDHAAFEARLRGSITIPEIIESLLKAVTSP